MKQAPERTLADVVQEAIQVWIEATGTDPEKEWGYGQTYNDAERIGQTTRRTGLPHRAGDPRRG